MAKSYSNEIKQKALSYYEEGLSAAGVSRKLGMNEATVRSWLKKEEVNIRIGGSYNKKYDEKFVKYIKEMYRSGIDTPTIEKKLNLKRGVAVYLLEKCNFKLNHRGPQSKICREDFFDSIDSEEKAYYLGWLMADGNVSIYNNQYSLKVHIALRDKEIIDNFLKAIQSTNKTKERINDKNPSYYVSLTSVHMCKSLINLGVKPNKTSKEAMPNVLNKELVRHFIRGFFDGDGITCTSCKRSGFVSSKKMLDDICKSIEENLRIRPTKSENIFYFLGGKKFSKRLYHYMYDDSNVWLSRKRKRMEEICFK